MTIGRCASCGGRIAWAQTPTGARIPLNIEADPRRGNVALDFDTRPPTAHVVPAGSAPGLRTAHFATCPKADQHRARKQPDQTQLTLPFREG